MFHHACLKKWFDNIRVTNNLSCPVCKTEITDTSETPDNDLEHGSNDVSESIE